MLGCSLYGAVSTDRGLHCSDQITFLPLSASNLILDDPARAVKPFYSATAHLNIIGVEAG